jgi:hypothetical protein
VTAEDDGFPSRRAGHPAPATRSSVRYQRDYTLRLCERWKPNPLSSKGDQHHVRTI